MKTICALIVMISGLLGLAQAAVSLEEAKQLNSALTPWGAIRAGNRDGTIPSYEGGLPVTTSPPGFVKNSGRYPDPFADEKPLFSVTAENMGQYADKLSEATKEMLKRFPVTYRINVYPTHRVVNYPKFMTDNSIENATRCRTIENGLAVADCFGGTPFPIPKTGNEQMWNVQLAYRKPIAMTSEGIYVDTAGTPVSSVIQEIVFDSPYCDPKSTMRSFYAEGGQMLRGTSTPNYPPRVAGDGIEVIYFVNPIKRPNKGWNYQQGNRRVLSIPDAQYDYPLLASGGAEFFDEALMYMGKQDRYDFRLLGTKEMIIPYNSYRAVAAPKSVMTSVAGGHHPNPDALRWELHRVTVVEANLKTGMRHSFLKRRFYMDEDFPIAGMADAWDHSGTLYRGYFNLFFWAYDKQTPVPQSSIEFDLVTGIWYMNAQLGETSGIKVLDEYFPNSFYTPEGLARRSSR